MLEGLGIKTLMKIMETLCGVTCRVASVSRDLTHRSITLCKVVYFSQRFSESAPETKTKGNEMLPEDCVFINKRCQFMCSVVFLLKLVHFCCDIPLKQQHSGKTVATLSAFPCWST